MDELYSCWFVWFQARFEAQRSQWEVELRLSVEQQVTERLATIQEENANATAKLREQHRYRCTHTHTHTHDNDNATRNPKKIFFHKFMHTLTCVCVCV